MSLDYDTLLNFQKWRSIGTETEYREILAQDLHCLK